MVQKHRRFRPSQGFTLVELLVVIAIIGVLVALLLPAVQAAREAARRSSCSNKLKQMSLAMHNFHDKYNRLPPGAANDIAPFSTGPAGGYGTTWLVFILPEVEQQNLFDNMRIFGGSGWGGNAVHNKNAANGASFDFLHCPSSPLEKLCSSPNGGGNLAASTYVGNSGVVNSFGGLAEARNAQPGSSANCCSGGIMSWGGVLYTNSKVNFSSVTDGTSNTIAIGEQGDFLQTQNGQKHDRRSSGLHGFMIGTSRGGQPATSWTNDLRQFNTTTNRYRINQMTGWTDGNGNCGSEGICQNASSNLPYNSTHPGGAQFGYVDGSVHFIPETIDDPTLARLLTRDDGLVLANP